MATIKAINKENPKANYDNRPGLVQSAPSQQDAKQWLGAVKQKKLRPGLWAGPQTAKKNAQPNSVTTTANGGAGAGSALAVADKGARVFPEGVF